MSATQSLKAVATGKAGASDNPIVEFKNFLEARKGEIAAALPRHLTADRVTRLVLTEFSKNAKLRECTMNSIYAGVIQASQLGLEIGVLGQAYLVPYNNKKKDRNGKERWVSEAQLIPGYKGLISLARRSGDVTSIETHIVYDNDQFELELGIESKVVHKPNLDGARGAPRLVYGVAHFKDGGYHFEWMSIADVQKVRSRSKAKDSGPWVTDYEQMVRKTLIRRMANYLPMSIELAAAVEIDSATAAGKRASLDGDYQVVIEDDDEPGKLDAPAGDGAGEHVDQGTGEITPGASPEVEEPEVKPDKKANAAPRPLTQAQLLEKFAKAHAAKDVDLLDAHADLIKQLPDEAQQKEAYVRYQELRTELVPE